MGFPVTIWDACVGTHRDFRQTPREERDGSRKGRRKTLQEKDVDGAACGKRGFYAGEAERTEAAVHTLPSQLSARPSFPSESERQSGYILGDNGTPAGNPVNTVPWFSGRPSNAAPRPRHGLSLAGREEREHLPKQMKTLDVFLQVTENH